jgi:hypothetical protein
VSLYRFQTGNRRLEQVASTRLSAAGIWERRDLQQALAENPDVLEPGLFVVTDEFSDWADSKRRVDLLCLDRDGVLVVVELKRQDIESSMDLQSIRYAAMCANMTFRRLVKAHAAYRTKLGIEGDAESALRTHLSADSETDPQLASARPRIMLVAEGFTSEVTTTVLWLNQYGLDIRCKRIEPYQLGSEVLLYVVDLIPLPETQDFMVRAAEKAAEEAVAPTASRAQLTRKILAEHGILKAGEPLRFDPRKLNGLDADDPRLRANVGPDPNAPRNIIWEHRPETPMSLSALTGGPLKQELSDLRLPDNLNGYTYWCLAKPGPGQEGKTLYELAVEVSAARGEPLPAPEAGAL